MSPRSHHAELPRITKARSPRKSFAVRTLLWAAVVALGLAGGTDRIPIPAAIIGTVLVAALFLLLEALLFPPEEDSTALRISFSQSSGDEADHIGQVTWVGQSTGDEAHQVGQVTWVEYFDRRTERFARVPDQALAYLPPDDPHAFERKVVEWERHSPAVSELTAEAFRQFDELDATLRNLVSQLTANLSDAQRAKLVAELVTHLGTVQEETRRTTESLADSLRKLEAAVAAQSRLTAHGQARPRRS